jgi:hypothetical protein
MEESQPIYKKEIEIKIDMEFLSFENLLYTTVYMQWKLRQHQKLVSLSL